MPTPGGIWLQGLHENTSITVSKQRRTQLTSSPTDWSTALHFDDIELKNLVNQQGAWSYLLIQEVQCTIPSVNLVRS